MAIQNTEALRTRTVGNIAATLPGATAVFRKFRIDFCCSGELTLEDAARRGGLELSEVEQALETLSVDPGTGAVPTGMSSDELIDHIQTHYHEAYRRVLPELIALSRKVETVHRGHPRAPAGLADVLQQIEGELRQHIVKEETVLFPAIRQSTNSGIGAAIGELRHDHESHGTLVHRLENVTDNFTLPAEACRSWQALYVGAARLAEDLTEHIHLENNILFPRFATMESRV
ncbi:regulator of cell morphogenesis and NO signaling [Steroidobacter denitrificans]|uniref:Regulator of cell morphogenesis and NO signaling n=1 Tax=Steroidobacter denitrificans TaxID=465721 RepID=A0A127FC62_STEDE|nr:iron-sulfur cluster repair di-iron protein [Steroidobacter denitrificans]AMN47178.1 regulator of cell morphogenesis and NO signaling [Steroidobacter denitrificans]